MRGGKRHKNYVPNFTAAFTATMAGGRLALAGLTVQQTRQHQGAMWYRTAHLIMRAFARRYSTPARPLTVQQVAGVTSVLSQNTEWGANLSKTRNTLIAYRAGAPLPSALTPYSDAKIEAILALRGPAALDARAISLIVRGKGGNKTRAFTYNLLGLAGPVTIDLWMRRLAGGVDPSLMGAYAGAAAAVTVLAAEYGMAPATMQAVLWVLTKAAWNEKAGALEWGGAS